MKASRVIFVLSLVLAAAGLPLIESGQAGALTIEEIMKYRTIGEVRVSPDGQWAVFVVSVPNFDENVMNSDLWLLELATSLPAAGRRYFQLTRWGKRDSSPRWSPDGKRIAFLSDRTDKVNIWVIPADGGEAEQITKVKTGVNEFAWLPDSSGFIFTMTDPVTPEEEKHKQEKNDPILVDKDIKYARLYRCRFGDKEPTKLTTEDYHVNSFDVSPDGNWVAFGVQPTPKVPDFRKSDLKLLNLAPMESGEIRDLVVRPGQDSAPRFSPDGNWIAFVSSDGADDWIGNTYVCAVRPDGSGLRNLSQAFDEQVGGIDWSADGTRIYFTAFERASHRLFELTVASGTVRPASSFDAQKAIGAFDLAADGKFVLFALSDPHTPVELYRLALGPSTSLRASSEQAEKLTSVNADYGKGKIGQTELIVYKAPDGLEVEGLLVKPVNFQPGKRYPLLVIIHGGPAGVFEMSFTPRRGTYPIQTFAEQGYLVWLPNPRGSAGFGYQFRRANYRDWGYGDYRDIMAGVDLLIERGLADPERMGVMGWSYGGYMTSWIVTQTDRFKAASVGAGLPNLYSLFGTTDIPEALEAYFGGRPWEDAQNYLRHSAIDFVENAKTPTLIQHGQQDRRVEISQAEEFYVALKKLGVPVEMVIYPRQGHGIQEPKLVRDALERNLNWFNKWLLGIEPPTEEKKKEPTP